MTALSPEAVRCFAHGVAHLINELGTDEGISQGAELLAAIRQSDWPELLAPGDPMIPAQHGGEGAPARRAGVTGG